MPFPIYMCGNILFRNGKPAFSKDCCCLRFPCCSDCYFPSVSTNPYYYSGDPNQEPTNEQLNDIGGPTQIVNFNQVSTDMNTSATTSYTQSSISTHRLANENVSPNPDCNPIFRVNSDCRWTLHANWVSSLGDSGTDLLRFSYVQGEGWGILGPSGGNFLFESPDLGVGECAGFEWDFIYMIGSTPVRNQGSFQVIGSKPWPEGFSCQPGDSAGIGFLRYNGRYATENDLPPGFL